MISDLINKQDSFEVVRDKIALILATESESQQSLAVAAGEDPAQWKLRVFTERSQPWNDWYVSGAPTDRAPIINVWYENGSFDSSSGDVIKTQLHRAIFNVDCIGLGVAKNTDAGHDSADELAAKEAQRAAKLVRNILMSGVYTRLDLTGTVFRRWVNSISLFQPNLSENSAFNALGARISLAVDFNETSPQVSGQPLELISIFITRSEDGQILAETDFIHTGAP